jgi:hypothetical protein
LSFPLFLERPLFLDLPWLTVFAPEGSIQGKG